MGAEATQPGLGTMLLQARWRQCSLFSLATGDLGQLPGYMAFEAGSDWLMICTQSCSVCSDDHVREPNVEIMAVTIIPALHSAHKQARSGAMVRELIIRVQDSDMAEAVLCDISRRTFIARSKLLSLTPYAAAVVPDDAISFQGWMARFYARLALPTELGRRLRASGLLDAMRKLLRGKMADGREVHLGVDRFYVRCPETAELPSSEPYLVDVMIVCIDDIAREHIDRAVQRLPALAPGEMSRHAITMDMPDVKVLDEVTLRDIRGYSRLNDWDAMSGMADFAASMRQA